MTEPSSSAVEQAIAARIAKVRAEGERRRQQREELGAARDVGLGYRHAQKLRNLANDQPQTTEDTPMPAAIRRTVCPACRQQRPARLVSTVVVATTPYDVLKCLDEACGLLWCAPPERPRAAPAAA